jgi:hypothetical protein
MSAGWFALGGVLIGGLLNGGVSWLLARSTMRANARVCAALLLTEELLKSLAVLITLDRSPTWGPMRQAADFGTRDAWDENRATLGHALSPDGYMTLATAYRGISFASSRARAESDDAPLTEADKQGVNSTFLAVNRGLTCLGNLIHRPPSWNPSARRKFDKNSDEHIKKLLDADPMAQTFVAKYGKSGDQL